MANNTLEDLREHLFDTLKALKDKEAPMSIERARAISEVGQTIINSAKAEIDYLKVTDQNDARLPVLESKKDDTPAKLPEGVVGLRTNRLT